MAGCASAPLGPTSGVAQGVVKGTVTEVNQDAQAVLQEMGIQVTGTATKDSGKEMQLTGKQGEINITVTIDDASATTSNVEVQASKNAVSGNKSLAEDILNRIVGRS